MQKIFSSSAISEVNIVKSLLENEGIEAYIFNEHINNVMPHIGFATGGIQLFINESDIRDASKIIDGYLKNRNK